jgi:hypothetical protein
MARSVQDIYDLVVQEKQSLNELSSLTPDPDTAAQFITDVNTTSRVAEWRLWTWVFSVVSRTIEEIFDRHKDEMEAIIDPVKKPGTINWYAQQVKLWQYGDALQFINNLFVYSPVNPANRIIKRVSVKESNLSPGQLIIKVAKEGNTGDLQALSNQELQQLADYLNDVRFAGTRLSVASLAPDSVQGAFDIYYNGQLNPASVSTNCDTALQAYLQKISSPDLSGQANNPDAILNVNQVIDALQAVPGVTDLVVTSLQVTAGLNSYPVSREFTSQSGYFTHKSNQGTVFTYNLIPV